MPEKDSGGMMKLLLIGGGLYLAYQYLSQNSAAAVIQTPTGGTAAAPVPVTTGRAVTAVPTTPVAPLPASSQLEATANQAGYPSPAMLNTYQWNYFYTVATGMPTDTWGPSQLYPNDPARETSVHTASDYTSALASYFASAGIQIRPVTPAGRRGVSGLVQNGAAGMYGWH